MKSMLMKQPREMGEHNIKQSPTESEMAYLVSSVISDRNKPGGKTKEDNRRDYSLFRMMKDIMKIKYPFRWEEGGIGAMHKPQSSWFRKQASPLYEFFPDSSINPNKKVGLYLIW